MKLQALSGLVALTLALSACGTSSTHTTASTHGRLDTARVARAIVASIQSQRHIHAVVKCPVSEPFKKGLKFVCVATTSAGRTPFEVTEVDNRGSTSYVGK